MSSKIIQLKDLDTSPNDLLFPITTGEAVSVTYGGSSTTLQSVVDLIPGASSGGGGSTQTLVAKNVVLSGTPKDYVSVDSGATFSQLSVQSGSLSQPGIVQLSNNISSSSDSTAATSSAVKSAYDLANAAIPKSIGTTAGDIIYFNGSGSPVRLAKGTAGQVLTMNSGATAPSWATPSSGGVSTHTLLSSSVHTDTTDGIPTDGNIIVGNGSKWTSQSFETFANTYHAVPLVGHFDTEGFSIWYLLNAGLAMNNGFVDDVSDIMSAASDPDSDVRGFLRDLGRDNLSKFTVTDVTASDVITALESGRPVYIIGELDATELGFDESAAEQVYEIYGKPRMVFTPLSFYPSPMRGINRIEFVSTCGVNVIGGVQITWDVSVVDPQNPPSDFSAGCGMIMLPRYNSSAYNKLYNMPFNEDGYIRYPASEATGSAILLGEQDSSGGYQLKYSNITFGSDTTKYLRNDGQWVTPSGGGGGTTVSLPSGYSASTGITLSNSALTTVATVGGVDLKLQAPSSSNSWTPTQLSSGFRIWSMDPGIYQMPASGSFYYYGSSNTSYTCPCKGGILFIYTGDSSIKQWFVFNDAQAGTATYNGLQEMTSGWTSSSSGNYTTQSFVSTNAGQSFVGWTDSWTVQDLNAGSVTAFYEPGFNHVTLSSTSTNIPTNLTVSGSYQAILIVTKSYNLGITPNGVYSRQDLIIPEIGKHWYRYITRTNGSTLAAVSSANSDTNGWVEVISMPRYTSSDAGKCLQVAIGGTGLQWATVSGGGGGGYSFKYDELSTLSTATQGYLTASVTNTSPTEKLFTYIDVGTAYAQDVDQGQCTVLLNIQPSSTVCPGEHYLTIYNHCGYPLIVNQEMILINNSPVAFYPVANTDAWADIPNNTRRLFSYIILNHNGTLTSSPSIFITWCGDYNEI